MKKRLLGILLTVAILLTFVPTAALAEDTGSGGAASETTAAASGTCGDNLTWVLDDSGTLTISGTGAMYDFYIYSDNASPWNFCRYTVRKVVIGDGVTSIGNQAFYLCGNLTSVKFPDGITRIGDEAFFNCTSLTGADLPDSVTSIGMEAFFSCEGMTAVRIPDSVTHIGERAFAFCSSLTSVSIPAGVTSLGEGVFGVCTGLTRLELSAGMTSIESGNFYKCSSLKDVYFAGTQAQWDAITIGSGNDPLLSADLHCSTSPFVDVQNTGDYFYTPVLWAVDQGITSGTSKTTFSPNATCTRGQVVTFLWRAAGKPTVSGSNPFVDVKKSDYYYDAVLWAVSKGITKGTSKTTFSPNQTCTRGQVVTFMYRAAENPAVGSSTNPFADVRTSDYYYSPVLWAVEQGITKGTSKTAFSPNQTCTRGQVVTFLYRYLGQ